MLISQTKEKATIIQHYQTRLMRLFCNTRHCSIHVLHGLHSMYQMKLKSACQQTRSYKFSYISGFTTLCCLSITQDISKPCCKKELEKTLFLKHALCSVNIQALILKQILCLQWQVRRADFGRCRFSIPLNTNPQFTTKQTLSNQICCVYIQVNTDTYQTFSAEFTYDWTASSDLKAQYCGTGKLW